MNQPPPRDRRAHPVHGRPRYARVVAIVGPLAVAVVLSIAGLTDAPAPQTMTNGAASAVVAEAANTAQDDGVESTAHIAAPAPPAADVAMTAPADASWSLALDAPHPALSDIGRRQRGLARLQDRIADLGTRLEQAQAELADAHELPADTEEQIVAREQQIARWTERIAELRRELGESLARLGELTTELDALLSGLPQAPVEAESQREAGTPSDELSAVEPGRSSVSGPSLVISPPSVPAPAGTESAPPDAQHPLVEDTGTALDQHSGGGGLPPGASAALDPDKQDQLDDLLDLLAHTQGDFVALQGEVIELLAQIQAAEDALAAALAQPTETLADKKAKDKAIQAALKVLSKLLKKLANLLLDLGQTANDIDDILGDIEELQNGGDPGGGDPGGGDPGGDPGSGDPGGDPDPGGGGNPSSAYDLSLTLEEILPSNGNGFNRNGKVATFGVPIPESWSLQEIGGRPSLGIAGSSTWQFRTLANWPDGSVKWALVDVRTNVNANSSNTSLILQEGPGTSGQSDIASNAGGHFVLDTGPLVAHVLKNGDFNIVDFVTVDGTVLVDPGVSPGIVGETTGGATLSPGSSTNVVIEENGPARATIRADGTLETSGSQKVIDFTCRVTARAGSSDLEVTFTVRNANIQRPQHTVVEGIELWIRTRPGNNPVARLSSHTGMSTLPLGNNEWAYLHQAHSGAATTDLSGSPSSNYKPHIPYSGSNSLADNGYKIVSNDGTIFSTNNEDLYPKHGFGDLTGDSGGVTVALRQMPYFWPMAIELREDGLVGAGVFTPRNGWPFTFAWRQHESRSVLFSFHRGAGPDPSLQAKGFDFPVGGRVTDYKHYDDARVFPYRLMRVSEQNQAYALMGLNHNVTIWNEDLDVTRFLPAHGTGGANNHASIERRLVGEWLRHGHGGQWLEGMDLALYKSEWQIERSDNFDSSNDPGANNDGIPHSEAYGGDDEHRYRTGMVYAYYLTGDERIKEALFDEEEILSDLDDVTLWAHERSMYQTLRAQAVVAEFTDSNSLRNILKQRLQYILWPTIDIYTATNGWGWEDAPGQGSRRFFANGSQNISEMPPGEEFQCRGFISASFGPIGFYEAAKYLGPGEAEYAPARLRMADLSWWTRQELYPWNPDPEQRRLVYSYAISLQQYTSMQNSVFHPILLGMAESYVETGDFGYLDKGVEQVENFKFTDQGSYQDNMYLIDSRLDCQHFFRIYLNWAVANP